MQQVSYMLLVRIRQQCEIVLGVSGPPACDPHLIETLQSSQSVLEPHARKFCVSKVRVVRCGVYTVRRLQGIAIACKRNH